MANKQYVARETSIQFTDSSGDIALTLNNLAAGAARISTQKDLGAGSTPGLFTVRGVMEFDSAPAQGEVVDIYISTSDGTDPDGQEGVTDAAVGDVGSLDNMMFVGSVVCTTATVDHQFTASFTVPISTRYYSIVVYNRSAADNLQATANTSWVIVTPVPPEIQ